MQIKKNLYFYTSRSILKMKEEMVEVFHFVYLYNKEVMKRKNSFRLTKKNKGKEGQ